MYIAFSPSVCSVSSPVLQVVFGYDRFLRKAGKKNCVCQGLGTDLGEDKLPLLMEPSSSVQYVSKLKLIFYNVHLTFNSLSG